MPDGVKAVWESFTPSGKESQEQNLRTGYEEMAAVLRNDPKPLRSHLDVINESLAPFAEDFGELVVVMNGEGSRFELDGKPFTNFGIILLESIHIHYTDHSQHDLELLIWGQHLPPKIVRLEAKRLGSSAWLDDLGPKYICASWGVRNLKTLI